MRQLSRQQAVAESVGRSPIQMPILDIVKYPEPVLSEATRPVENFDATLRELAADANVQARVVRSLHDWASRARCWASATRVLAVATATAVGPLPQHAQHVQTVQTVRASWQRSGPIV